MAELTTIPLPTVYDRVRSELKGRPICIPFAAGYCRFGHRCRNCHDSDAINAYERGWVRCQSGFPKVKESQVQPQSEKYSTSKKDRKKGWRDRIDESSSSQSSSSSSSLKKRTLKHKRPLPSEINERLLRTKYKYAVVLDYEGLPEIMEFPAIILDLDRQMEIARFHRFVRPSFFPDPRIADEEYYRGLDQGMIDSHINTDDSSSKPPSQTHDSCFNPESRAVEWKIALRELCQALMHLGVAMDPVKEAGHRILWVSCGNYEIKTITPKQCRIARVGMPKLMKEWLNIKDLVLNCYDSADERDCRGMASVLRYLKLPLFGNHHSGMDDTFNIACIALRCLVDGYPLVPTAQRDWYTQRITYTFRRRINPLTTGDSRKPSYRTRSNWKELRPRELALPPRRRGLGL